MKCLFFDIWVHFIFRVLSIVMNYNLYGCIHIYIAVLCCHSSKAWYMYVIDELIRSLYVFRKYLLTPAQEIVAILTAEIIFFFYIALWLMFRFVFFKLVHSILIWLVIPWLLLWLLYEGNEYQKWCHLFLTYVMTSFLLFLA